MSKRLFQLPISSHLPEWHCENRMDNVLIRKQQQKYTENVEKKKRKKEEKTADNFHFYFFTGEGEGEREW